MMCGQSNLSITKPFKAFKSISRLFVEETSRIWLKSKEKMFKHSCFHVTDIKKAATNVYNPQLFMMYLDCHNVARGFMYHLP